MQPPTNRHTDTEVRAALAFLDLVKTILQESGGFCSREQAMTAQHGELISLVKAGKILDRSPATVRMMTEDGRLQRAADGKILVSSIASYLEAPEQHDYTARIRRRGKTQKHILVPSKQKCPGGVTAPTKGET